MKVFAFINGQWDGGDVVALAVSETGIIVGQHVSSSKSFAKMDIGAESGTFRDSKIARYEKKLGEAVEIEWVDDPENHPGVMDALRLNQSMHEHDLEEHE